MALDGARLTGTIYSETKSQLLSLFGGFKTGLLAGEQASFDDAIDRLAQAIANGDGNNTVDEITVNARVKPNTLAIVPAEILDSTSNPCSGNGLVQLGEGLVE